MRIMARSHLLPFDRPPIQRLLQLSLTLMAVVGGLLLFELFFGQVVGSEFSPDRFERRRYRFYQIPWLEVQFSPVARTDISNDLERYLRRKKLIQVAPVSQRWDPVNVSAALTLRPGKGQAIVLCRYLDQQDDQRDLWWLEWTKAHPELARPLWSAVQEAADLQAYFVLPALFELAAQAKDPATLSAQIDGELAQQYGELAQDYAAIGQSANAQRFRAAAQTRDRGDGGSGGFTRRVVSGSERIPLTEGTRRGTARPMEPIYLDHNATTPIDPAVVSAMVDCYQAGPANPASPHAAGRMAQQRIEEARQEIARILGGEIGSRTADVVVFTSGGTESNNLAIRGLAGDSPGRFIVSTIEHSSTLATAQSLQQQGWQVEMLRVGQTGQIDLDHLAELLREPGPAPCLVSIMLANHETGVLQPIQEAAKICRDAGAESIRTRSRPRERSRSIFAGWTSTRSRSPRTNFTGRRELARCCCGTVFDCNRSSSAVRSRWACDLARSRWHWPWACKSLCSGGNRRRPSGLIGCAPVVTHWSKN